MVQGEQFEKLKHDHNSSIHAGLSMEVVISEVEQSVVDTKRLKRNPLSSDCNGNSLLHVYKMKK